MKGNFVKNSDVRMQESEQLYMKYGKKTVILGWHEIRQLLHDYLPSGTVQFDKQVCRRCSAESCTMCEVTAYYMCTRVKCETSHDASNCKLQ